MLRRLDIDPEAVEMVPREPSEILTRCLGTRDTFPRQRVLDFAAVSTQPCAIAFISKLRKLKKGDLEGLSFEAMCVYANVNPIEMLGAVMASAINMKAVESKLKAALAHPEVVEATVEAAKIGPPLMVNGNVVLDKDGNVIRRPGDVAAQKIMHEAVGFLPSKKGGGIAINFGFGRPAEERGDGETDADADWDDAFPPLGEAIQEWSASKHKMIEATAKE